MPPSTSSAPRTSAWCGRATSSTTSRSWPRPRCSSLPEAEYARFAGAVLSAATTISQAGTGFWGIGRTLPQHVRLTLQAIAGLLGIAAPGAARRATLP